MYYSVRCDPFYHYFTDLNTTQVASICYSVGYLCAVRVMSRPIFLCGASHGHCDASCWAGLSVKSGKGSSSPVHHLAVSIP